MNQAINNAIAMLQDYKNDLAKQDFPPGEHGDMLQLLNCNKRNSVDHAIKGLREELAVSKTQQRIDASPIKRYDHVVSFGDSDMEERDDGDWVRYDDFEQQLQRIADLELSRLNSPPVSIGDLSGAIEQLATIERSIDRRDARLAAMAESAGGVDERAAFEAFWRAEMNVAAMDLHRFAGGYSCHETNRAWMSWQARAALTAPSGGNQDAD